MQDFPHYYLVSARGAVDGDVQVKGSGVAALASAPPIEFDGPGDRWSPETLLVGAVSDCFVLTFRAVARASKLAWTSIECDVIGRLDRVDRVTRFTRFDIHAHLTVPASTDREQARRVLERAERGCLVTSSLKGETCFMLDIEVASPVPQTVG